MSEVVIYQNEAGAVDVRLEGDTVWLRQEQIAALFGRDRSVVARHIGNVFKEGELDAAATCAKFAQAQTEGNRQVTRDIDHYNLDVIISVGYRGKSPEGVRFRQWATRLLREHLTRGYTLNRQRLEANARELEAALALVRKTARAPELSADQGRGLVDIVSRYAQTFLLLQRYEEGLLTEPETRPGGRLPAPNEARQALARLKVELMARGEAGELFAANATTASPPCSATSIRPPSASPCIPASRPRPPTCCTSSSRTTPSPTATSAAPPTCSWISSTAMPACSAPTAPRSSTTSGWPR